MKSYEAKVAVITGAGNGIGRTIAQTYAQHGATVVLIDKEETGLRRTEELLREIGAEPKLFVLDLSKPSDI
jgi:NAD(P)-dependent dehydrogenase (short-subunit alcohol dehydrogenase family)